MADIVPTWVAYGLELLDELIGVSRLLEEYRSTPTSNLEVMLRTLAAGWLMACTLAVSLRIVRIALPRVGLPLRWASVFSVGAWLATVGFHLLRTAGLFKLPFALLACTGLLAAAHYVRPERAPLPWVLRREWRAARAVWQLFRRTPHASATMIFAAFALLYTARSLVIPTLGWDTQTYHSTRAAIWVQSGQFTFSDGPGTFQNYRHFFGGAEVLLAWAMLPFHSDLLANLAVVVQWLGVGLACWALARELGVREPFAATSAGIVMFIPSLVLELGTSYVEPALNGALLQGIALAIFCLRRPSGPVALLSACALGVAIGVKLPGGPPGIVAFVALALRVLCMRASSLRSRVGFVAASLLCVSLPALPWMFEAWRETGYPLGAMPVKIFGVALGELSPELRWYYDRFGPPAYAWPSEKQALLHMFSPIGTWNEALGSAGIIPILALPLGVVALLRRRPLVALVLLLATAMPVLFHFSPKMSIPRLHWAVSVSRYLVTFFALAVPLSFAWCSRTSAASQAYRRLLLLWPLMYAITFLRWGWGIWEYRELLLLGVVAVALIALVHWSGRYGKRVAAATAATALMLACAWLQLRRDFTRQRAFAESFALHTNPQYWSVGLREIDERDRPRKIALTGGPIQTLDSWFSYAFLGSHLQNEVMYVPPTHDGRIAHYGPYGDLTVRLDKERWLERLAERQISEVISFAPRSLEQGWMEQEPTLFQRLAGDGQWGLFRRIAK